LVALSLTGCWLDAEPAPSQASGELPWPTDENWEEEPRPTIQVRFDWAPISLEDALDVPQISALEPTAAAFQLENAIRSLDATTLDWQQRRRCLACHTNVSYPGARAMVTQEGPSLGQFRSFALEFARTRWSEDAYVVVSAQPPMT